MDDQADYGEEIQDYDEPPLNDNETGGMIAAQDLDSEAAVDYKICGELSKPSILLCKTAV